MTAAAATLPKVDTSLRMVPLAAIVPNRDNPRKHFPEQSLAELAESIRQHGVLEPVILRVDPLDKEKTGCKFELVVGERRWRASKLAGQRDIPARVLSLTDREALEMMVIENLQREDVHPLDEAAGYQALLEAGSDEHPDQPVTVADIAKKVGKSESYIYGRLKLRSLANAPREALDRGLITHGHAVLIARLQPPDQCKALAACFEGWATSEWKGSAETARLDDIVPATDQQFYLSLLPEKGLREWIRDNVNLKLKGVPWDLADANLVPEAGACNSCPKRTKSNPALFAELSAKGEDACFDAECFKRKREAFLQIQLDVDRFKRREAERVDASTESITYVPLRQISDQPCYMPPRQDQKILKAGQWVEAKTKCVNTEEAIFVRGEHAGERRFICADGNCKIHPKLFSSRQGSELSSTPPKVDKEAEERERKLNELWFKQLEEILPSKVDGADRAAVVLLAEVIYWNIGGSPTDVPSTKTLAKLPLHKAWTALIQAVLVEEIKNDPDSPAIQTFAKTNKLDLAKLEKEFRAKHSVTSAPKAEPNKGTTARKKKK